jgi:CRISPR-associated exonuclease Cas4
VASQGDDFIPISALNQLAYCPRRCYLIHAEGEFEDNVHTLRGSFEHERVDELKHEVSAGVRVEYGLPVWSQRLGLSGRCDVVEFRPDGSVYPVEYKHGRRRRWFNDDLQLGAQALCLEEALSRPVHKGAIYHQQSRRRREVVFDAALRDAVEMAVMEVRRLICEKRLPPPVADKRRCPECSLREICQPELARAEVQLIKLHESLFEPEYDPA